jgi:alkaline phosphatase D
MPITRRKFIQGAAASAALIPLVIRAEQSATDSGLRLFRHGVASGDPLTDRVMLWTRVTIPPTRSATGPVEVQWVIASDEGLQQVVARGTTQAAPERDFTVKVDAGGLAPGRTYHYAFTAGGERSPIGRTKTLPSRADRLRFASVSCANYPAGYFNAYRCIANRSDLDAVIHLGDYIYEFANGRYGDGSASGRVPGRAGEASTLEDYRDRYATYRSDIDLQEVHRRHPFVAVWDDHESANDAWSGGAGNHNSSQGSWTTRLAAAYRAYLEWLPIRESSDPRIHLYRSFRFGDLVDLVMLDTRGLRDEQASGADAKRLADPSRTLLGAEQEAWFFDQLRTSQKAGSRWRLIGQQILFTPLSPPGFPVANPDVWDGYAPARHRVFDFLASEKITNMAILTGDIHSSWAMDVTRNPWTNGYDPTTGAGSVAVELVTPAISSPPLFGSAELRQRAALLRPLARHLKFLEGDHNGYTLLDITRERILAEWYHVDGVAQRSEAENKAASFVCEHGSSRLSPA